MRANLLESMFIVSVRITMRHSRMNASFQAGKAASRIQIDPSENESVQWTVQQRFEPCLIKIIRASCRAVRWPNSMRPEVVIGE